MTRFPHSSVRSDLSELIALVSQFPEEVGWKTISKRQPQSRAADEQDGSLMLEFPVPEIVRTSNQIDTLFLEQVLQRT